MYQSHGWWFPDQDTHFDEMLAKNIAKGGEAVYQLPVRQASIELCNRRGLALDIGANVGLWAQDMCDNFQTVLAFEPVADFRLCLERNVPAKNLFISPLALGAENTMVDMIITEHNTGHSHVDTTSMGQGSIQMLTLDTFMETYKFGTVDYIKIDCEGFENNIIAGAKQTILRDRPIMVVEDKKHKDVGHNDIEAVPTLLSWGARILKTVNNDVVIGW